MMGGLSFKKSNIINRKIIGKDLLWYKIDFCILIWKLKSSVCHAIRKIIENFNIIPLIIIKFILEMRFKERDQSSVRAYQRISLGKRKRLVELVVNDGQPLSKIVKKLKIKLTTARLILTKYKQTGQFPMRDFKKRAIKQHNSSKKIEQGLQSSLEQCGQANDKTQHHEPIQGQPYPTPFSQNVYTYQCMYFNPFSLYLMPYGYN